MVTKIIKDGKSAQINLGDATHITINARVGIAEVHVDYKKESNSYSSAVKASARYESPMQVIEGKHMEIKTIDLESETIRVKTLKTDIALTYL